MRSSTMILLTTALAAAAPATAQTLLDSLLARVSNPRPAAAVQPVAVNAAATISPAQTGAIDRLLAAPVQDARVAADRTQAAGLIHAVLATGSCARDGAAFNALTGRMLTPTSFGGYLYNVLARTKYHDPATCLDVARLTEWSKPALNALAFRAYYVAPDSGEAVNQRFTLQRAPDGQWLIRQIEAPQS